MFSILGMINSYIGYFNMNATLKNRIYTVVGGVGNFYLLYVAYRFFANGFIVRGLLFILAFLALLYFTYLNILYFFTVFYLLAGIGLPLGFQWCVLRAKERIRSRIDGKGR